MRNLTTWQDELQVYVLLRNMNLTSTLSPLELSPPSLQRAVDSRELLCEGMALYVPSDMRTLTSYQRSVTDLQHAVKSHVSSCGPHGLSLTCLVSSHMQAGSVNAHVLGPFQSLLSLFQDPLRLISKRRDKLLDFDHLQYALDHHSKCCVLQKCVCTPFSRPQGISTLEVCPLICELHVSTPTYMCTCTNNVKCVQFTSS